MIDLKRMRKEKGLKQKDVAKALGITQQAWTKIEKGSANLTDRNKMLLMDKLNVNPKFLEDGSEPIFIEPPTRDLLTRQIIKHMDKLDDSNRQIVLDLITSLENNNVFKDDD